MMLAPVRARRPVPPRRAVSKTVSVAAPIGGLNAIDAVANMPATDAVVLENVFPSQSEVVLRNGSQNWATGLPAYVESLMPYASGASTKKLFAASGTAFYDVSSSGAVGAAVVTGLLNAQWESVNIGTPAGQFLYCMNGVDKPRLYNGSTWNAIDGASTPSITGVTTTSLRSPVLWANRLWCIEVGTFHAWYLPILSVGGAASKIDLSAQFFRGGSLLSIITASISSASTVTDYIGFLSTEGELAVFSGNDPDSGNFFLQGRYYVGHPVGRRCWVKYGSDTWILTQSGGMSLIDLVQRGFVSEIQAKTKKIDGLIISYLDQYGTNTGWQMFLYPEGNKLIINVPKAPSSSYIQLVMNTSTNAWCTFTGWNGACFEQYGPDLFFGGSGVVVKADVGTSDNGSNITGRIKPAFSYFGHRGLEKHFKMIRPIWRTNGKTQPAIALNVDFEDRQAVATPSVSGSAGSAWNVSAWNTSPWSKGDVIQKDWQGVQGIGFAGTVALRITSGAINQALQSIDYLFEVGGVL